MSLFCFKKTRLDIVDCLTGRGRGIQGLSVSKAMITSRYFLWKYILEQYYIGYYNLSEDFLFLTLEKVRCFFDDLSELGCHLIHGMS